MLSSHMRREPPETGQEQEPPSAIGTVTRVPLLAGMPLTDAGLIRPGEDGFLAAVLLPDRRALTITVDQEMSHAGMIRRETGLMSFSPCRSHQMTPASSTLSAEPCLRIFA